MKIDQLIYKEGKFQGDVKLRNKAQWVIVFGNKKFICDDKVFDELRCLYPDAYIMGCSTAGDIKENIVIDGALSATAVFLEKSSVRFNSFNLKDMNDSYKLGQDIVSNINSEGLKHIFILCEGININGSKLVDGLRSEIDEKVPITGGLSGDDSNYVSTYVIANDYAKTNLIVAASFYGGLESGCASVGGWDTFGIERLVTKAKDNILYEIDGKPALDLYKEYLGDLADELPESGLLFPLNIRAKNSDYSYVRTINGINESDKSLSFAGDIPENSYCRLMKSNSNNLINGARQAAELGKEMLQQDPDLAILISCVGRKLVLKQLVDDEVEAVREIVGNNTEIIGFYSYGEISPYRKDTLCEFHNQTMTITLFKE